MEQVHVKGTAPSSRPRKVSATESLAEAVGTPLEIDISNILRMLFSLTLHRHWNQERHVQDFLRRPGNNLRQIYLRHLNQNSSLHYELYYLHDNFQDVSCVCWIVAAVELV